MNTFKTFKAHRLSVALVASLVLAACGSSSSGSDPAADTTPQPTTGIVGLFFTDAPTDYFKEINLDVTQAILIGDDNNQQVLFDGNEPIDLLNLENYNEPIIFGEVDAGTYTKIRLVIDNLELVPHEGDPIYPKLPANGKIDLLDQDGFDVLPGRTIMVEIDMDANKSIKITQTGNAMKYNFRPVVKVQVIDAGLPDKLARVEGSVAEIYDDPAGSFLLCDIDTPESCVTVATGADTSIFNDEGLGTEFSTLAVGDMVVVIGRYSTDPDIVLNAIVLEIGGTASQIQGNVVTAPADSQFLVITVNGRDLTVELQPETKYFNADGETTADAIMLGSDIEVEGVEPPKADEADPDVIRAALVLVEADEDAQLSGTIIEPIDADEMSFGLSTDGGDTCVRVNADADILLVDAANSTVTMGVFADLAVDQSVDVFGTIAEDSCMDANEVIVEVPAAP